MTEQPENFIKEDNKMAEQNKPIIYKVMGRTDGGSSHFLGYAAGNPEDIKSYLLATATYSGWQENWRYNYESVSLIELSVKWIDAQDPEVRRVLQKEAGELRGRLGELEITLGEK